VLKDAGLEPAQHHERIVKAKKQEIIVNEPVTVEN
jgi:hypothetical protein